MPDVGVLYLTIKDNADEAAGGLEKLAGALNNVQKAASGEQIKLTGIVGPLNRLSKAVNDSKSLANVGTFLNAVREYTKAFQDANKVKFNSDPIDKIKAAIGDGIKIGQAGTQLNNLRTALQGEWNTDNAYQAGLALSAIGEGAKSLTGKSLATVAKNISATAKALNEYADAAERVKSVVGTSSGSKLDMTGFEQTEKGVWKFNPENARSSKLKLNLQFHGWREDMSGMSEASKQVEDASAKLESAKSSFDSLRELTDIFRQMKMTISGGIDLDAIITNLERLKEAGTGGYGLTTLVNSLTKLNASISETVSGGTIEGIRSLADALAQLKASTDGLNIPNIKINFGGGGRRSRSRGEATDEGSISETLGQVAEGMQSAFTSVESSISGIVQGAGELVGELIQINTVAGNAADEAERMARAFAELFRMASMARSASSLPWGGGYGLPEHGFVQGEGSVSGDKNQLYLMGETASNAVETMNDAAEATKSYTVACEEALQAAIKLHREQAEKYATKDWSFEDVYYGTREKSMGKRSLMSEWLHGQGTEHEQTYALKSMAQQFGMTVDEVKQKIAELNATSPQVSEAFASVTQAMGMSKADLMQMKYEGMLQSAIEARQAGKMTEQQFAETIMRLQDYRDKLLEARAAQEGFSNSAGGLGGAIASFGAGIKRAFPALTGLIHRFKNIVKYRMLRSVIRYITAGFSEGIQNVYKYSEAIGGSFAPAMDSAASAIATMKNSLGAALAPALQSLIPILNTLVSWFITLVNVVNQFFSLFRGQATWTKAVDAQTTAYKNNEKAAKGAGGAAKDLLADWDELNIIQSESSGGGGGGSGLGDDFASMFEEVGEYAEWIRTLVDGIKEEFGSIWDLVKRIGLVFLGWKFSKAFTGVMGILGSLLGSAMTFDLIFKISSMLTGNYLKTGEKGWLVADVLSTLVGGFIAKALLKNVLGGALASYAIPIAFGISAAASLIALVKDTDVTALSEKGILTALNTALEGGVAAGAALYSLGGYTAGLSTALGLSAALFTFGAAIGIKAIAETVDTGEITADTIWENLVSAGAIGGSLALTTASVFGTSGTVGSIIGAGVGGSLFTLGALFLVEMVIQSLPDRIKWGNETLTQSQIEAFVKEKIFRADLYTNIELAANAVTMVDEQKEDLKKKVRDLIPLIDAVVLGVDGQESISKIDEQVNGAGGIVDTFNALQKAKKQQLTVAFSSVQVIDETGTDQSSDMMKVFGKGLDTMDSVMANLGKRLADAVKESYDTSISENAREMAKKTVLEVTQAMMDIEGINTANQTAIQMRNKFKNGIEGLDQQSIGGLLNYYNEQKELSKSFVESQYQTLLDEAELQQANFTDMAQKAKENGGEFAGYTEAYYLEMAKSFEDMYKRLEGYRDDSLEAALKFYESGGEGLELIRKYMLDLMKGRKGSMDDLEKFKSALLDNYASIFSGDDSVLFGDMAEQNIRRVLMSVVEASVNPQDWSDVQRALNTGVLKFSDFIDQNLMNSLADRLGIKGDARVIWDKYAAELLGYDYKPQNVKLSDMSPIIGVLNGALESGAIPLNANAEVSVDVVNTDKVWQSVKDQITDNYGLGNIDLNTRAVVNNPDGSISTEKSISVGIDDMTYLLPTIINGVEVGADESIDHFLQTGEHLGIFSNDEDADKYAQQLHERQDMFYGFKQEIQEALKDGILDPFEAGSLIDKYTMPVYQNMLDELGYEFDELGNWINKQNSALQRADMVLAKAGMSDVNYTPKYEKPGEQEAEPIDYNQMATSVQNGVSRGNVDQNSLLGQMISLLRTIAAKDTTVVIKPSSTLGHTTAISNKQFENVRGPA